MKRFLLAVLAFCLLPMAAAQAMLVSPTAYNINPLSSNTAQVRFENQSAVPMKFRVEVMHWSTENGAYVYTPTRDVVANPPEFTVQPGSAQVIRVGVLKKVGDDELTYRVFIRQVAITDAAPTAVNNTDAQLSVNSLSTITLPVYIAPPSSAPKLSAKVTLAASGELELLLTNTGNRHLTLRQLQVQGAQTVDIGSTAVLGNSVLRLPLTGLDAATGAVQLVYRDAQGEEKREPLTVSR